MWIMAEAANIVDHFHTKRDKEAEKVYIDKTAGTTGANQIFQARPTYVIKMQ
jgi:hypothetical protein